MKYEKYKSKINFYLDKIIEKHNIKDEDGMKKIYDEIEKLELKYPHWAAKYEEDFFSC